MARLLVDNSVLDALRTDSNNLYLMVGKLELQISNLRHLCEDISPLLGYLPVRERNLIGDRIKLYTTLSDQSEAAINRVLSRVVR